MPFFDACNETRTTINMHIGAGSKMPSTSPDAPAAVGSTLTFANCCFSMVDWLMSGIFTEFPDLKIAYSEGQIGWIPYILERADTVWQENRGWGGIADKVLEPPSELFRKHVYGCFFDDPHGLTLPRRDRRGQRHLRDRLPAQRRTWPHTAQDRRGADGGPLRRGRLQGGPRQRDQDAAHRSLAVGQTCRDPHGR